MFRDCKIIKKREKIDYLKKKNIILPKIKIRKIYLNKKKKQVQTKTIGMKIK